VVQEYSTLSEAVTSTESGFWVVAMNEEIESLCKNQTWDLKNLLEEAKTVGLRGSLYGLEQSPGLYVDGMLIAAKSMFEVKRLKSLLGDEFEMKDLGLHWIQVFR
jgi:hypothetical protein